jgi:hypothetical protein
MILLPTIFFMLNEDNDLLSDFLIDIPIGLYDFNGLKNCVLLSADSNKLYF